MEATVWNDYVCPWAYLGRHLTAEMESLGVVVVRRPFELHPELGRPSRPVRPDGRLAATFTRVAALCDEVGMAFHPPSVSPNTRMALELAEIVRLLAPEGFAPLDDALFEARFVHDRDLADPAELVAVLAAVGLDSDLVEMARRGEGAPAVEASMAEAREVGATATPTWRFEGGFVLSGVHPTEQVRRWVGRIKERSGGHR